MKKKENWFQRDWKKIDKTKTIIYGILNFGITMTFIISTMLIRKMSWYNSLSTAGALGIAGLALVLAVRWSMFDNFVILYKNYKIKKYNKLVNADTRLKRNLYDRNSYQEENRNKAWTPFLIYLVIYLIMVLIGISLSFTI